jgi:hypothetical protein
MNGEDEPGRSIHLEDDRQYEAENELRAGGLFIGFCLMLLAAPVSSLGGKYIAGIVLIIGLVVFIPFLVLPDLRPVREKFSQHF